MTGESRGKKGPGIIAGGLILPLALALFAAGTGAQDEARQLFERAKSVHQRLFPELQAGEQEWIRGLAKAIGSGEMNEEELVKAVTGPSSRKHVKPERAMFHACFLAVPIFDREIAKARREIERLDREIGKLEERLRKDDPAQHDLGELLKKASEEREREMTLFNALLNRKSHSVSLLSSIVKSAGSTDADVIKNLG